MDLTVSISSPTVPPSTCDLEPRKWHRVEKHLYLYTSSRQSAWLYVQLANEEELVAEDLLVIDIRVGVAPPPNRSSDNTWESRPGGIWVLKANSLARLTKL